MSERDSEFDEFYTWDKEGKKAVGALDRRIGDVLKDKDIIYVTYVRSRNMTWIKIENIEDNLNCRLCGRSNMRNPLFLVRSTPYVLYCEKCFNKVRYFRDFTCYRCSRKNVPLDGLCENIFIYEAKCESECLTSDKCGKECQTCSLPLIKSQKCGRCKTARYCSRECQKEDWPKHKQQCRSEDIDP